MKQQWKGVVSFLLAGTLMLLPAARAEDKLPEAEQPPGLTRTELSGSVESERLSLRFDPRTAAVSVKDKQTGLVYTSNPAGADEDARAKGVAKMELKSQITITYIDENSQQIVTNSFKESIQEDAFGYEPIENGVLVTYYFGSCGFTVPVRYTVCGDYFAAEIDGAGIRQEGNDKIISVSLLPYFGAGGLEENGYLFVPDGSGSLIEFNSESFVYQRYDQPIYGRDRALNTTNNAETKQDIKLPCFGISRQEGGFLAVVAEGAAQGEITASISQKKTSYNNVYSTLRLIQFEVERLMENTANAKDMTMTSNQMIPDRYQVRYYFLDRKENSYVEMANLYTDYLLERGLVQSPLLAEMTKGGQYPINLDTYGAIPVTDTFLGVPYSTVEVLTSIEQLSDMAESLRAAGAGALNLRYLGWSKGGMNSKTPNKIRLERQLGSLSRLKQLQAELESEGGRLALAADFVNLYKGGNGINTYFDTVQNISRAPALQYHYLYSTGSKNKTKAPWYLIAPDKAAQVAGSFADSALGEGLETISVMGLGNTIYSNFQRNSTSAVETERIFASCLEELSGRISLQVESPNGYALPHCDAAMNVPVESSGFDVELRSVPFYAIALSGYVPCFSEPVNMRGDTTNYLLKLVESGVFPSFELIGGDPSLLVDTDYTHLYSTSFPVWEKTIATLAARYRSELSGVAGKRITSHRLVQDGVSATGYGDGTTVYVNHTNRAVTVEGLRVPAKDFMVKAGDK